MYLFTMYWLITKGKELLVCSTETQQTSFTKWLKLALLKLASHDGTRTIMFLLTPSIYWKDTTALVWCSWVFFLFNTQHASNHEETSLTPKLKDVLQNKWPVLFENVKIMEGRQQWGIVTNKRTLQRHDGIHRWTRCQNENVFTLRKQTWNI